MDYAKGYGLKKLSTIGVDGLLPKSSQCASHTNPRAENKFLPLGTNVHQDI
jgi:hypothetical protein